MKSTHEYATLKDVTARMFDNDYIFYTFTPTQCHCLDRPDLELRHLQA